MVGKVLPGELHCVMLHGRGGNWPRELKHPYSIR